MKRVSLIILCTIAKLLKLSIAGFEPRPSVDGIDCSTNCAINTKHNPFNYFSTVYPPFPKKFLLKAQKTDLPFILKEGRLNFLHLSSVTRRKSPNVYKSCPKMISLEK